MPPSFPVPAEAVTRRVLRALRDAVDDSELDHAAIEERSGFPPGYLSQVLAANVDLKYRHVVAILDALRLPPASFFAELFPPHAERRGALRPVASAPRREAVQLHAFGVESVVRLRRRLASCESALGELSEDRGGGGPSRR